MRTTAKPHVGREKLGHLGIGCRMRLFGESGRWRIVLDNNDGSRGTAVDRAAV